MIATQARIRNIFGNFFCPRCPHRPSQIFGGCSDLPRMVHPRGPVPTPCTRPWHKRHEVGTSVQWSYPKLGIRCYQLLCEGKDCHFWPYGFMKTSKHFWQKQHSLCTVVDVHFYDYVSKQKGTISLSILIYLKYDLAVYMSSELEENILLRHG